MGPRLALLIAVLALGVIVPGAAASITVSTTATSIVITGTGGNSEARVGYDSVNNWVQIYGSQGATTSSPNCGPDPSVTVGQGVVCDDLFGDVQATFDGANDYFRFFETCFSTATVNLGDGTNRYAGEGCTNSTVTVNGGSGEDQFGGSEFAGGVTKEIFNGFGGVDVLDGGAGDDVIHGGEGADAVAGEAGNDMVYGDAGNDELRGGAGDDTEDGGAGDDTIGKTAAISANDDDQGSDDVRGGAGADKLILDKHAGGMVISLDDVQNDGAPGENDNIHSDIEDILGTVGADTYTGTANADKFDGERGNDIIHGGGGNDEIFGGSDQDQVFGDAGDDRLLGDYGDDTVDGGPGVDSLFGDLATCNFGCPSYNDTIKARDGEIDSVQCGAGADTVEADATDVVAQDGFQHCETVDRAAPAPAPAPALGPAPGPGATSTTPFTFSTLGSLTRTKGVRVKVTCSAPCTITATLVLGAKTARKVGLAKKAVTIGTGRATRLSAGSTTVTIRLTKKAKSRLRRLKTVTATLKLAVKDSAGTTTRKQRAVKLKR